MFNAMVCIVHSSAPKGQALKGPGKNMLMYHLEFRIYLKKTQSELVWVWEGVKSANRARQASISRGKTSKRDTLNNSFHLPPMDDRRLIKPSLCDQRGNTHFQHNYVAPVLTIIISVSKNCLLVIAWLTQIYCGKNSEKVCVIVLNMFH